MESVVWKKQAAGMLIAVVLTLVGAIEAGAQMPAAETFEPQAVGASSIWSVATSDVSGHLIPSVELVAHYADDPIELKRRGDASTVTRLVDEQYKLDVGLGVGVFERLELGLMLPVVVHQSGDPTNVLPSPNTVDLADARAHLRLKLLREQGFGLGAQVTGYLPTSGDAPYQSSDSAAAMGSLIADYRADGARPWRVAANVGWLLQPQVAGPMLATDDRLDVRVGAEVGVVPDALTLMLSGFGRWEALADVTSSVSAGYLGGARIRWGDTGLSSTLGAGGALAGGYGTPDVRVVASLGYAPTAGGATDVSATTSNDAPSNTDKDGDGVVALDDACPDSPGTAETAGCPFDDEDNDGIDASVDPCPDDAEDFDGFEDQDGCPDFDNDRDGVADVDDACPDVPESMNGVDDQDGCPDEGDSAVRLHDDHIEILERVHFDTNRASIKRRSHSVLEQVAAVLEANPDIRLMRIQGHTDARGDERANLELSQQRAVSVKEFLIERGVDARRLSARGYGESHPIADNEAEEGRAQNRRVEFHIIERSEIERGEIERGKIERGDR